MKRCFLFSNYESLVILNCDETVVFRGPSDHIKGAWFVGVDAKNIQIIMTSFICIMYVKNMLIRC